jgi:hypothetical protein
VPGGPEMNQHGVRSGADEPPATRDDQKHD